MSWITLQDSSSPWGDIWGIVWSDFTWWTSSGSANGSWVALSGVTDTWIMSSPSTGTWIDIQPTTGSWITLSNPIDEAWGDIWGYIWGQPSWIEQSVATGNWGSLSIVVTNWIDSNSVSDSWKEKQPISIEGIAEAWGSGLWSSMHWDGRITTGTAWVAKAPATNTWTKVA